MSLLDNIRERVAETFAQLRSLPILKELWEKIKPEVTTPARRSEGLDFVLTSGYSIAQAAALMNPGQHGAIIVTTQRAIEFELRAYCISVEQRLFSLQRTAAQATGAGAVRAVAVDKRIAALERENKRLENKIQQLQAIIEELRSALAEKEAAAKGAPGPAAAPVAA